MEGHSLLVVQVLAQKGGVVGTGVGVGVGLGVGVGPPQIQLAAVEHEAFLQAPW